MPATEGSFVPIFGVCVFFAIIPIIVGSKKIKIAGSVLLALALILLVTDYVNGKKSEANFIKKFERTINTEN